MSLDQQSHEVIFKLIWNGAVMNSRTLLNKSESKNDRSRKAGVLSGRLEVSLLFRMLRQEVSRKFTETDMIDDLGFVFSAYVPMDPFGGRSKGQTVVSGVFPQRVWRLKQRIDDLL